MMEVKPPVRFTELTPSQRQFIGKLDEDDLAALGNVIKLFSTLQSWCRVNRWIVYGLIAALFVTVQFFDATFKLIASFGGSK